MKRIAILGSTGSIGQSALAVIDAHPDKLQVVALAAGENAARCAEQVARVQPDLIAMATAAGLADVQAELTRLGARRPRGAHGPDALIAVATHPDADVVLFASSGTAGLDAVLAAIDAGKTIALANKEILVMAGGIVMEAARRRGATVLPVDSEHNAIHQCLDGRALDQIRRLILTASGGPFRNMPAAELARVTPEDALRHPTWRMGPKITIDSATLMNKGLEVIEARWLFDIGPGRTRLRPERGAQSPSESEREPSAVASANARAKSAGGGAPAQEEGWGPASSGKIDVVVHPQSIVHSMVEFVDGSVLAQLGVTDMRLPIQYAFSYPERWIAPLPPLDLTGCGPLEFETPDTRRFPGLGLAFRALAGDAGLPIVLNAANEVAVAEFLDGRLPFPGITDLIQRTMDAYEQTVMRPIQTLTDVRGIDAWAREYSARSAGRVKSKV